jgi:SNF2 family DNA or RNA helicase
MLPTLKAYEVLAAYEGTNNQLLYWKFRVDHEKAKLTRAQAEYILNYHDKPVRTAKKHMKLDPYFLDKLREEKQLKDTPENVWVEKLLAESDKALHVMGKVGDGPMEFLWIPKCFIIREKKCDVVVDYEKYAHRPPLTHQKEAIEKLLCNDKFILADDMGLGKSFSTVIASLESKAQKILIVCPATLKINWKREILMCSNESIYVVDGKKWEDGYRYYIINYDIIKNFHGVGVVEDEMKSRIQSTGFELIIIDESHMISNPSAQRTQLINDIAEKTKKLWLLTGTPMTSRPINYYNLLKLIDAPVAYNWQTYVKRYCKGFQFKVKGKRIWNVNGASNLDELREKTKPYLLRRLKTEVLDLPEKIITPVYLELKSKAYEEEMGEYLRWEEKEGKEQPLAVHISKLMNVRMLIAKEKVDYTIEMVERLLAQEKKVIVFTNFTETLDLIAAHFKKQAVKLDGRMSKAARQQSVDEFQTNPKIMVFVSNLKAGGVGITLTEAEAVIISDLSFVPVEMAQAEDRAYRYGQNKSVSVYYPVFENTIEMQIYDIVERKKKVINTVMGDNLEEDDGGSVMKDLLNTI